MGESKGFDSPTCLYVAVTVDVGVEVGRHLAGRRTLRSRRASRHFARSSRLAHLPPALCLLWYGLRVGLGVFVLARFGLLAFAAQSFASELLSLSPLTADLSVWYAYQGILMALVVLGLAGYAFVVATRGQRLFQEGFFGDE